MKTLCRSSGTFAASGFAVLLGLSITVPVMIVYALVTLVVYSCAPDQLQQWLMKCYFGRNQSTGGMNDANNWNTYPNHEQKDFEALSRSPIVAKELSFSS